MASCAISHEALEYGPPGRPSRSPFRALVSLRATIIDRPLFPGPKPLFWSKKTEFLILPLLVLRT